MRTLSMDTSTSNRPFPSLPARTPDAIHFAATNERARAIAEWHGLRVSHSHTDADGIATIFTDAWAESPDPANPEYMAEVRELRDGRWRVRVWI